MNFSFLMCINKDSGYAEEAIMSVLSQTEKNFKFYIIANNCSDSLWEKIKKYDDPRIEAHRTRIGQLAFNLNYGVNLIKEGYILRMDADDISLPDRLDRTIKAIKENNNPDALICTSLLIDEAGVGIGQKISPPLNKIISNLWIRNSICHPAIAIKAESLIKMRGYLGGFMSEDYDLWIRASKETWFRFALMNEPVLKYRISQEQSKGHKLAYSESAGHLLKTFLNNGDWRYALGTLIAIAKRYINSTK